MSALTAELAEILSTVVRPGDFYATGTTEVYAPGLEVDGVGVIALPLLPSQAAQLIAVAERAPYGRGEETLVDTGVRRVWQIRADQVRFQGRHWGRSLEAIVARAAEGLGVSGPVEAELHKLLVYDQGSFFISHRDTEKAAGMFATLVIVLPSLYTGGELVLRHKDRDVTLDLRCADPSDVSFAAFYADCLHEVLPVTSGCRLTLVYNLLRRSDDRQGTNHSPQPPSYESEQARSAMVLRQWAESKGLPDDDSPEKLIYPLEHAYTPAELSFAALKGADAAVSAVLTAAAPQADCDLHLALVSIEESGVAEHADYYPSRRRWRSDEEDDEYEIVEVSERTATLSNWHRPDGGQTELGALPFEDDELCPPDALAEMEPDELYFQEATGNEGASFARTYRRAALVLWPQRRWLAVLAQAGLRTTLPYLAELTRRWEESDKNAAPALWQQAQELSGHMLRLWPRQHRYSYQDGSPGDAATMLRLSTRLHDADSIDAFLATITAAGLYGKGDNEAILMATRLLRQERTAELLERIIAANAPQALGACADLLARAAAAAAADGGTLDLRPAATTLLSLLPGDPARAPNPAMMWRTPIVDEAVVVDTLAALGGIDAGLADAVADYMLAWPKTYDVDAILIPALLRLNEQTVSRNLPAVRRLRSVCVEHLRARIAQPLEPPRDWTRASTLTCRCPRCTLLSQFLAEPSRETWTFKAAEPDRQHLEGSIRANRCDLDVVTERKGRPYSLVCTKNQASYDRRAKQRTADLEALARLGA
jgi:predicted 2-oxoglutarate/Fe(II)-dependent dioxygenase YbiX